MDEVTPEGEIPPLALAEVPDDLPEDVRASYKPRSFSNPTTIDDDNRSINPHQNFSVWSIVYQDRVGQSPESSPLPELIPDSRGLPQQSRELTLNRIIGEGGFGEVWEATQASLGRVIAIKRMRQDIYEDPLASAHSRTQVELNFRQEAFTAANLDHPNIIPVHDLGRDSQGRSILAMKRLRGKPWEDLIDEDRTRMAESEFLARHLPILIQLAQAVAFAHSRGIVHRDLKPTQVMVGEFGEVVLMDWGLAVVFDVEKTRIEGSRFVESGYAPLRETAASPAGTIAYMSPEQTEKNALRIGPWTDLYLLGGILYLLLTASVPHRAPGNVAAFYKAMKGEVEHPRRRAPNRTIPDELSELCLWAMHPDIDKRLSDAKVFIEKLQAYLGGVTRKEESMRLVDQARSSLGPSDNYQSIGRALMILDRAATIWPRNPQIPPLLESATKSFAELAIRNNDLVLARLQVERLEESEIKEMLLTRVARREEKNRTATAQRHRLRVALVSLSILLILAAAFFTRELLVSNLKLENNNQALLKAQDEADSERKRQQELRTASENARGDAETLVDFLVTGLASRLEKTGQLDELQRITERLLTYYEESDTGAPKRMEVLANILAARTEMGLGSLQKASTYLLFAWDMNEALLINNPGDANLEEDRIRILQNRMELQVMESNFLPARETGNLAINFLNKLEEIRPNNAGDDKMRGRILYLLSISEYHLGNYEHAVDIFTESMALHNRLALEDPNDFDVRLAIAEAYDAHAGIDWESGRIDKALDKQIESLMLRESLALREPWNLLLPEKIADNRCFTAFLLYEKGDFHTAEQSIQEVLTKWDQTMGNQGGRARERQFLKIRVLHNKGTTLRALNRLEEAIVIHQTIRTMLEKLSQGTIPDARVRMETMVNDMQQAITHDVAKESVLARQFAAAVVSKAEGQGIRFQEDSTDRLMYYAMGLILTERRDPARQVLSELIRRNINRRDLYEVALRHGYVEPVDPESPRPFRLILKQ